MAALAEGIDRRMLHQEQIARALRRGSLGPQEGVEKPLLVLPAGFVVHLSEVPAVNVHRCKLLTLFRASSAKYDERTSGALAQ